MTPTDNTPSLTTRPERGRGLIGVLLLLTTLALLICLTLGSDLIPAGRAMMKRARTQLEKIIGQKEMDYERARFEYERARDKSFEFRRTLIQHRARIRSGERAIEAAKAEIRSYESMLARIDPDPSLSAELALETLRPRSGEARQEGIHLNRRIALGEQRLAFLETAQQRRLCAYEYLVARERRLPLELQRLRDGLDYLRDKIDFYKEVQVQAADNGSAPSLADLCERATVALEKAHLVIDVAIATVTSTLDFRGSGYASLVHLPHPAPSSPCGGVGRLVSRWSLPGDDVGPTPSASR